MMDNKERIIEGAADLFRNFGIKAVTMDSIAGHLGMSKRTIYENFTDKDDLLVAVMRSMAQRQRDLVKRVIAESENSIVAIFRLLEINRDHFQSMSPAFQADLKTFHIEFLMKRSDRCEMPDFRDTLEVIENGIKENYFRKSIDADIVNRCLYRLGTSLMDNELFPYEIFTRKDVVKNVMINYLRGISTSDGLDLINSLEKKF